VVTATIGFRAKTGKVIAIALKLQGSSPAYVERWQEALYDPTMPATGQPHHEVMELPWADAQSAVRPLELRIERIAVKMLSSLVRQLQSKGLGVSAVGIVGSPDRKLDRIGNPHIRAHAAEGILFRRVLEIAAAEHELQWRSFSDRALEATTFAQLRKTPEDIKNILAAIGRVAGKPWRSDERAAALAAWLVAEVS
jgi:hypothetical protein